MDLVTVKLAFVVLGVVGLAVWQLYDVNRELSKHDEDDTAAPSEATESQVAESTTQASQRSRDSSVGKRPA